jgi:hypothetical protein
LKKIEILWSSLLIINSWFADYYVKIFIYFYSLSTWRDYLILAICLTLWFLIIELQNMIVLSFFIFQILSSSSSRVMDITSNTFIRCNSLWMISFHQQLLSFIWTNYQLSTTCNSITNPCSCWRPFLSIILRILRTLLCSCILTLGVFLVLTIQIR